MTLQTNVVELHHTATPLLITATPLLITATPLLITATFFVPNKRPVNYLSENLVNTTTLILYKL